MAGPPADNGADNLKSLVAAALSNLPQDARIFVGDDSYPDGTGNAVIGAGADIAIGSRAVAGAVVKRGPVPIAG